jgi:hypothetical protein
LPAARADFFASGAKGVITAAMRLLAFAASLLLLVSASETVAAPKRSAKKPRPAAVAPPKPAPAPAPPAGPPLVITETVAKVLSDYQAETYSAVSLGDRLAKERGLDKGLVLMVMDNQRRATFRVPRADIQKLVRLVVGDPPGGGLASPVPLLTIAARPAPVRDRIDVLETTSGTFVVETKSLGMFTTSDVYAFPKGGNAERMLAAQRIPASTRERIARALVLSANARP